MEPGRPFLPADQESYLHLSFCFSSLRLTRLWVSIFSPLSCCYISADSTSPPHVPSKNDHPHEQKGVRRHIDRHRQPRKPSIGEHHPCDHCRKASHDGESTDPPRIHVIKQQRYPVHDGCQAR